REAKDNLKSTQLLSVIDAISEGPIEGPVDGLKSVLLNSTPVLGTEVKYDTPITRTITSANIDRLRFTFGVQALVETTSKGDR
ncbi:hypothetical protein MXL19_26525, partial [Escherichia coli]|nr:hypothetical protein [Escherichia coli]